METRRPTNAAAEEILGGYFPVLDHGFVALVDYMGTDDSVERAARVSYGYGTRARSQTRGLIRYLRRHRHTTPSEMVELKFHCAMPIFVARQWVRHRTACLAAGTEIHFDLPGGIATRGNQPYKLPIEEIWKRFQPSGNRTRPDERLNPRFRRDRIRRMHLRQMNEENGEIQHTRVVGVFRNGAKPVFRMTLEDGKTICATADHRFLFTDGWKTLRQGTGLTEVNGKAVWNRGDHYIHVNGLEIGSPPYRNRAWLRREYHDRCRARPAWNKLTVAKLVRIQRFEYVGERETYDLEVEGPDHNFIANGIVTHNSVNEYSGRYSIMPLLFYTPRGDDFALQSAANRQGRDAAASGEVYAEAVRRWEEARRAAGDAYGWMLGEDVARELARIDLPLSTYTQWYWKTDLHNLIHFLTLRVDPHAQPEIRAYAAVMAGMLKRVAPLSYEAWIDYEVCGAHLSRGELDTIRRLVEAGGEKRAEYVRPRAGAEPVSADAMRELGLSPREVRELVDKLGPRERPDFDLDLEQMCPPEQFEARMREAVPGEFE